MAGRDPADNQNHFIDGERKKVLQDLEEWLETPMLVLGIIWLALFVVEVVWGLSPLLEAFGTLIWVVFIFDLVLSSRWLPINRLTSNLTG